MKKKLFAIPLLSTFISVAPLFSESCSNKKDSFDINNYINLYASKYDASNNGKPKVESVIKILNDNLVNHSYEVISSEHISDNKISLFNFNFTLNTGITFDLKLRTTKEDGGKDIILNNFKIKMFYILPDKEVIDSNTRNIDGYLYINKAIEEEVSKHKTTINDTKKEQTKKDLNSAFIISLKNGLKNVWMNDKNNKKDSKNGGINWILEEKEDNDNFVQIQDLNIGSFVHSNNGLSDEAIYKYKLNEDSSNDYILKNASFAVNFSNDNFDIYKDKGAAKINYIDFKNSLSSIKNNFNNFHLDGLNDEDLKSKATLFWVSDEKYNEENEPIFIYKEIISFLRNSYYSSLEDDFSFNWNDILENKNVEVSLSKEHDSYILVKDKKPENINNVQKFIEFCMKLSEKKDKTFIYNKSIDFKIDFKEENGTRFSGTLNFKIWLFSLINSGDA